jgi:flagellar assembly factor FliW
MNQEAAVIIFPDGLPGFEQNRRYELLLDPSFAPFTVLRGLGPGAPSFATIDPRVVLPDYAPVIGEQERRRIGADAAAPLLWLAIVSPGAPGEAATANLKAPIVICPDTLAGLQIVQDGSDGDSAQAYRFDHPFRAA